MHIVTLLVSMTDRVPTVARLLLVGGLLFATGIVGVSTTIAQVRDTIPRNSDAELMFDQGLAAFEQGDYGKAAERFRLVNDYALNRKTTAALVMQGKAFLRLGQYQNAIDALETLLDQYPETSYRDEAERILKSTRKRMKRSGTRIDTLHVGIALPLSEKTVALTQAMFSGIRLAVDEHNGLQRRYVPPPGLQSDSFEVAATAEVYSDSLAEAEGKTTVTTATDTVHVDSLQVVTEQTERPDWIARMHFRQTDGTPEGARAAVDSLVQFDDVDVILGPLTSRTARAAGEVAEEGRTLFVAPLATEESVSAGRDYVFQTNPTISQRGRIMARFTGEGLLTESVSIIYEHNASYAERMAEGYREEAKNQGLALPFTLRLDSPRNWSRLPEVIEEDSTITDSLFAETDAFYLPVTGSNASGKIQDVLTGFERLNTSARILGNSNWHDLTVVKDASKFTTTYATDFNVQRKRPAVQRFIRRYRLLTGKPPDALSSPRKQRLAYTGYDVMHFLLTSLTPTATAPKPSDLRAPSPYEGLGMRIDFEEGNVNQAMFIHRYRKNRIERLR